MATKSILKNIFIKDKHKSLTLINAIEQSQKKMGKKVVFQKVVKEIKDKDIKKLFRE